MMNNEEGYLSKNNRVIRNNRIFSKPTEEQNEDTASKSKNPSQTAVNWNPTYNKLQEKRIIQLLQDVDYQEPNKIKLNMKFDEIVKGHIRFICGQPQGQSLIGANLISNGLFHYLWEKVLSKQNSMNFEVLKPEYYENYLHSIMDNKQYFEKAFSHLNCPPTQQNDHAIDGCDKLQDNAMEQRTEWESDGASSDREHSVVEVNSESSSSSKSFLPLCEDQIDKNQQDFLAGEANSCSFENQPTIFSYCEEEQLNQRRISAEIVCMFFNIPDSMIVHIRHIKIVKVLEKYWENKFQILVVRGMIKDSQGNCSEKFCISCYKFHSLEQLVRIEKTYGKVQIFMKHECELDFSEYLSLPQ